MHAGRPDKLPRVLSAVFLSAGLALVSSAQQPGRPAGRPISQQDAVTAGQLAGFRAVLAARHSKSPCDLTDADVHEQDSAAERLFFGRYNPNYRGRGTQGSAQFLNIAKQTQAAVSQDSENYDLSEICQDVLKEIAAFHPNVPRRSTEAAAVYCATWKGQSATSIDSCPATRFPQALGGTDPFQNHTFPLQHVTAYTGYCLGRTFDGILFQPTGTRQGQWCAERARFQFNYDSSSCNPSQPDPDTMRVIQFVSTDCPTCTGKTYSTGSSIGSECRALHGHVYYLDSVLHGNDPNLHDGIPYLHPDVYPSVPLNGVASTVHFISDEPTANMPDGQGSQCDQNPVGAPMTKSFYDFLMCKGQVVEVFRWSRTGTQAPVLHGARTESSIYSPVADVSPADVPHLFFNGLCDADNIHWYTNNADLQAIGKAMQCSWSQ